MSKMEEVAKNVIHDWCDWYVRAYSTSNTDPTVIRRNIAIIRDAYNSCHPNPIAQALTQLRKDTIKEVANFVNDRMNGKHGDWVIGELPSAILKLGEEDE